MDIEEFRNYCLKKPGVTEEFPFGGDTLVFKVMGKMFALTSLDTGEFHVNLKCTPELAVELREKYDSVKPGYHMNKTHWNTVDFAAGELPDAYLYELIDLSYKLVTRNLPLRLRKKLEENHE